MEPCRLPHDTALNEVGGYWILRWWGDLFEGARHSSSGNLARIASTTGPESLTQSDAVRIARRYLLSRLSPKTQATRALMTITEFVQTRFLPEFVATKTLAGRAHYHSILKYVVSPEEVDRACGIYAGDLASKPAKRPDWPYLGNLRFRDVRPENVQQLIAAALAQGYSPQTVRHIRSAISALFSYAKQELVFVGNNPAGSATVPELVSKATPALTLADVEHLLRAMRYPEKEMTSIALLTDMNVSEICGLQWKHVNLTGTSTNSHGVCIPPLTISISMRLYRGELADVKNARRRNIQIPEMLLPMLLLLNGRAKFTGPEDFVLPSRSGRAINATNITARRLGLIGRSLGIPTLTWQVIRRARAVIKANHGEDFQHRIAAAATSDGQLDRTLIGTKFRKQKNRDLHLATHSNEKPGLKPLHEFGNSPVKYASAFAAGEEQDGLMLLPIEG